MKCRNKYRYKTAENTDTNTVTKDLVTVLAVAAAHQNFKTTKRRFPPALVSATESWRQWLHY